MGKTAKIIEWFSMCPYVMGVEDFDVNQLPPRSLVAGLFKQPAITKEKLIDGGEIVTENYYLLFRKAAQLKEDRINNDDFLEDVENWVFDKDFAEEYPDIGYSVFSIESTNAFYMLERDSEDAVYQLTLSIKYERNIR